MSKIAVAEDSVIVNKHLSTLLSKNGYEVLSVFSGEQLLSEVFDFDPDLILIDIMMESEQSGLETTRKLKQTRDYPVVFLTALTDPSTLKEVKKLSPYGYITKPFNEFELITNVDITITKSKAARTLKNSLNFQQILIEALNSYLIVVDESGQIIYTNPALEKKLPPGSVVLNKSIDIYLSFWCDKNERIAPLTQPERLTNCRTIMINGVDEKVSLPISDLEVKDVTSEQSNLKIFLANDASQMLERKRLENELQMKNMTTLIEGQEIERRRVARELHDNLGQILNSVRISLKTSKDPEMTDQLISEAISENKRISNNLLPSKILDFDICKSIESLLDEFKRVVDFEIDFFGSEGSTHLPDQSKIHIYRMVQEIVSNAVKYSECSLLSVQCYEEDDYLRISIEDDGVGFDMGETRNSSGIGLKNLEYRANILKAEYQFETKPGQGTFFSMLVPMT